jgi:hypothetical protein
MNDLVQLTKDLQAPAGVSKTLIEKMSVFFQGADEQKSVIDSIVITKPDQVAEMRKARDIRLSIKNKRLEARDIVKDEREKLKNAMADFTLQDKLWLKSFQMLEAVCDNLEGKCEEKEKFAERYEAEQKQLKYEDRVKKLHPLGTDPSIYNLADMEDEVFEKLLENEKLAQEARIKAEEEAERQRIAELKAEKERQEAIAKENAELKKQADAREKELAKERAEQQKAIDAERKAREVVEAKAKAEKEAREAKEAQEKAQADALKKAQEDEAKKKLLAPDKEKLMELANLIDQVQLPAVSSKEANSVVRATEEMLGKVTNYIREKAKGL